jgi:tetratricopeptide (TPR) repeat protein
MGDAMYYIGMTYLRQNAYDEAVKRFQNASDLDRKNVKFQYWLGHTFRLQGKKVQAKELLLGIVKAIGRNPLLETQVPDVWIELGLLYKSQNKLGKAIKYFKRGLGKHEKRPLPWYEIPLYERALKLDKDFGEAWFKLAQAYIQQKKPDYRKTTDACEQAIDKETGVCWCLKQMALIYDERRKCKKALKHYTSYIKQCGSDLPEDEFRELTTAKIKLKRKCG